METERKVVAVSTARPAWHDVRGHQTFTSIVRSPAQGCLWFGEGGPEGNETAVHTEAVLASPSEHYAMWAGQFGVDQGAWDWCRFGENIVVSGFDENTLGIGDIVRIGAAVFRVTSPRIPCFKFAWRLGQPDSVLAPMIESGHIGFYLAVETPGAVGAGDIASTEASDHPAAITVGDLSRLLVARDAEPERLRAPLANPWLGEQARGMLAKRIAGLEDAARQKTGRWSGWRPFRISEKREEARDTASFSLTPVDGEPLAPPLAGQFLTVRLGNTDDAPVRSWTLSDHDDMPERYRLTVKRIAGGEGSSLLHEIGARGGTVWARPPAGRFTLKRDGFMRVVLISAGIGVTPMLAMLKAHGARQDRLPPLVWIHQTRSGETHAFSAAGEEATRHVFYSAPRDGDGPHEAGRLTPERLCALLAPTYKTAPFGREIELDGIFSDFYICGPAPFEAMVREALATMGVPEGQIRSESFVPQAANVVPLIARARVDFGSAMAEWTADGNASLLELAEAAGLSPSFGCRSGSCGACECSLVAGRVEHSPSPAMPLPAGRMLLCCARPVSADVTIAFD